MKSERGFTLVEILLATTILMIVAGVALESFYTISRSWERSSYLSDDRQMKRSTVESMTMQIKSAYPLKTRIDHTPVSWFFGGPDTLSFACSETYFRILEKNPGIILVTYSIKNDDENGKKGLVLVQDYPPGIRLEDGGSAKSLVLDSNAIALRFRYFSSSFNDHGERVGEWTNSWDPRPMENEGAYRMANFPELVEFKVGYPGKVEDDTLWLPPVKVSLPIAKTPLQMVSSFGGFFGGNMEF